MRGRLHSGTPETARQGGISIRTLSVVLFIASVLTILFSLFEAQRTMVHSQELYRLEQERQGCDQAIQEFMDGSDLLTDRVRQYVVKGERAYMDEYWVEVYRTRSRDAAVDKILAADITEAERSAALEGKRESDELIENEIWAMRMVAESDGMAEADMPQDVAAYRLSAGDAALTAEEKLSAAISYIFGPEYSTAKAEIRSKVDLFRSEISSRYADDALTVLDRTRGTSIYMSAALVLFMLVLIVAIVSFISQVVSPIIAYTGALSQVGEGQTVTFRERGASELRRLAVEFNSLNARVTVNTRRLERMGYIDYLTDVPNRASLTEYVNDLIARGVHPLGIMIVDIDNFKKFNDTYGHALGDRVLVHVARAVCSALPPEAGVSGRLCGEEFVVASPGADEALLAKTAEIILENVRRIKGADVNLPDETGFLITVSIGGMLWHGETPAEFNSLLSLADSALYESKSDGKDRYTFYK